MVPGAVPNIGGLRRGARRTTVFLVAILVLAVCSLSALIVWQNYKSVLAAGEERVQAAAHIIAAHMEWMIEAGDQTLRRIDASLGSEPIRSSRDQIDNITEAVGALPTGFQYSVYDESGSLRFSSIREAIGINVSDREYFRQLRDGAEIVISPQLEERLSGQMVFVVARRITRGGVFHGAASIALPVEKMSEFWASIDLGADSTVAIVREDGWIVARHPMLPQTINIGASPLFQIYLKRSPAGYYFNPASAADGQARIIGYRKVSHWPLVALAGITRDETLALFWRSLRSEILFALPAFLLLFGSAIWIVMLMRAYAARNAELETALERNRFLFREIHHRVKNNLQAVSSLIRLQPLPEEARKDMAGRIAAMVAVHEHIYRSDQFDKVDAAAYIRRLVPQIAASYPEKAEITMELEPLTVDRDMALPLGMIVNEAVSNAFKYAFAGRENGQLSIRLSASGESRAKLEIADNGPGFHQHDGESGMGSKLIAGFAAQLSGSYDLTNGDGVVFTLTFPLHSQHEAH